MKSTISLKKILLIGIISAVLGTSTAFAATNNSIINNSKPFNSSTSQEKTKILYVNNVITPTETLASLLGESLQTVRKASRKDFSDVYQYAQKKGVLNKYKVARIALAKENIQKAVYNKQITKKEGIKVFTKVQSNIINEKSEAVGINFAHVYQKYSENENLKKLNKEQKIVKSLKTAITNNEFFLVYQPQVDIKTGKAIGMEALLRWNSKELGYVPPSVFIPIAEKNGLIIDIGNWVTHHVCMDLEAMNKNNPKEVKGLSCSINFSPIQIVDNDFVENLLSTIKKYNIKYDQIEVEITESLLLQDLQKNRKMLEKISKLGITIAIDDFGTGYSSFSYLLALPINQIKIDRSFIKGYPETDDGTLITILIDMSKKLNKAVLVEGAETLKQINFLKSLNSDFIQGYYYSKPLLKKDFIKFVQKTNNAPKKILK